MMLLYSLFVADDVWFSTFLCPSNWVCSWLASVDCFKAFVCSPSVIPYFWVSVLLMYDIFWLFSGVSTNSSLDILLLETHWTPVSYWISGGDTQVYEIYHFFFCVSHKYWNTRESIPTFSMLLSSNRVYTLLQGPQHHWLYPLPTPRWTCCELIPHLHCHACAWIIFSGSPCRRE